MFQQNSKPILIYLVAIATVLLVSSTKAQESWCTVTIRNGTIRGILFPTLNPTKSVCRYFSIPFATPPVRDLRFKAPEPAKAWGPDVTLNATTLPMMCPQTVEPEAVEVISEDCLYLNVYQPVNIPISGLPVLIWFHGGSFTSGNSWMYDPIRLQSRPNADTDAIVVTVHYRLGLLGFLSTGDEICPGNNGLKDQALSIRWVYENIQAFGGDPDKITIFGESAGGASVMYQFISPLNKGLLSGAIAQSGTALSSWTLDLNPKESFKVMARKLDCLDEDDDDKWSNQEIIECLRNTPWEKIIKAQEVYGWESFQNRIYPYATMTPVVEPDLPGAFITETPEVIMTTGEIPDIPVIIGANKHDGSFFLASLYINLLEPQGLDKNGLYLKDGFVPDIVNLFRAQDELGGGRSVASTVEMAYMGTGVNRTSWTESMPGFVDMVTVFAYKSPAQISAEILTRRNRTVYLYSFEHHSNNSLWSFYFGNDAPAYIPVQPGVTHGDELIYLFTLPAQFNSDDQSVSNLMCDLWLNFAKFGNPTFNNNSWLPYNVLEEPYIKLNNTPSMQFGYRNSWRPNGFQWN